MAKQKIDWKNLGWNVLIDLVSIVGAFYIISLLQWAVNAKTEAVNLPNSVMELSEQEIAQLALSMQSYFWFFVGLIIGMTLLLVIWWSLTRAVIWRVNFRKKISLKYLLWAALMGVVWFGIGILIAALIMGTFKSSLNIPLMLVFTIIYSYLTIVLFMEYAHSGKMDAIGYISKAFKRTDLGFVYIVIFAIFLVLYQILSRISDVILATVLSVIMLLYFTAARYLIIKKRG